MPTSMWSAAHQRETRALALHAATTRSPWQRHPKRPPPGPHGLNPLETAANDGLAEPFTSDRMATNMLQRKPFVLIHAYFMVRKGSSVRVRRRAPCRRPCTSQGLRVFGAASRGPGAARMGPEWVPMIRRTAVAGAPTRRGARVPRPRAPLSSLPVSCRRSLGGSEPLTVRKTSRRPLRVRARASPLR